MLPPVWKIEGPFGGVDPVLVILAAGITAGVIVMTAVVARQLAVLQPKAPPPSQVQKASGEFDMWTERPKAQGQQDAEYYALYGTQPGRSGGSVSPRVPPAPPAPSSVSPLGPVVVDLSGSAPAQEEGWVSVAEEPPVSSGALPPGPRIHPPARPRPTGPTDEVVAPSHGRRVRDTSTGELAPRDTPEPSFERSSMAPGAVAPGPIAADPFSPKAPLPAAPPPPPPPDQLQTARVAESLPEGTPVRQTARTAFRGPSRGQSVVGAGQTGLQEGTVLSPEKKAIRCPKCQTVFSGPVTRPATVKCPACGTTGTLR